MVTVFLSYVISETLVLYNDKKNKIHSTPSLSVCETDCLWQSSSSPSSGSRQSKL